LNSHRTGICDRQRLLWQFQSAFQWPPTNHTGFGAMHSTCLLNYLHFWWQIFKCWKSFHGIFCESFQPLRLLCHSRVSVLPLCKMKTRRRPILLIARNARVSCDHTEVALNTEQDRVTRCIQELQSYTTVHIVQWRHTRIRSIRSANFRISRSPQHPREPTPIPFYFIKTSIPLPTFSHTP